MASTCEATIVGFGVPTSGQATAESRRKLCILEGILLIFPMICLKTGLSVSVCSHDVIYHLLDDVKAAVEKLRPLERIARVTGRASVKRVFAVNGSRGRNETYVAGCVVTLGTIRRKGEFRVVRGKDIVVKSVTVESMRHFKDEIETANKGSECGISLAGWKDVKEGDSVECVEYDERVFVRH